MRKWILLGVLAAGAAMLFAQEVEDWTARLAAWTATRDIDSPVRNAIHIRQTVQLGPTSAIQTNIYRVPANRRLALQQTAVYCTLSAGSRLEQAHVATVANSTVARFPLLRSTLDSGLNYLASPLTLYADGGTPVEVTLGFNSPATNGVCEITATGYSAQLNP